MYFLPDVCILHVRLWRLEDYVEGRTVSCLGHVTGCWLFVPGIVGLGFFSLAGLAGCVGGVCGHGSGVVCVCVCVCVVLWWIVMLLLYTYGFLLSWYRVSRYCCRLTLACSCNGE
jgi:hypothetical protein